ncbi:cytochrome P450 [Fomitopsis betulina]|nr:cytochrome P450 [Fomitopsis betulina]
MLLAVTLVIVFTVFATYHLWQRSPRRTASLARLPGPRGANWIYGNLLQIFNTGNSRMQEQWTSQYGATLKYKGWFNANYLYTVDTKALSHIMHRTSHYHKPGFARFRISEVIGNGLIVAEGDVHRRQACVAWFLSFRDLTCGCGDNQRRVLNPAFGPSQLRLFTELFIEKSIMLRDIWSDAISDNSGCVRVNIFSELARMTLDVMGSAGFGQELNILRPGAGPSELSKAFQDIFGPPTGKPELFTLIKYLIPPLRYLPTERTRRISRSKGTLYRIGMQLLTERKASISSAVRDDKNSTYLNTVEDRDLLTLLLKANMAADIPPHQRLSDDEVLAQIPSFLTAGYETTSNGAMWTIYALTQNPDVERRLMEELSTVRNECPDMDELQALPYLDAVVRESLRLHAPLPSTLRVAVKDDVIPLNKAFVDNDGNLCDHIEIAAGTTIDVPILALNRAKSLWGDDAFEFKPERWDSLPQAVNNIHGVWSNIMTFIGGPRACIGYRFAVLEIKALIFVLLRAFRFELAVPPDDLITRSTVIRRPLVRSEPDKGIQMPMFITPRQLRFTA